MNNKQNVRKLTDLLEYLKERHSNLPTLVFEDLGEIINDMESDISSIQLDTLKQSEKYNQMIGEAYENYMSNWPKKIPRIGPCTIEEFIDKCKTDSEFSKTWELKIEEKEHTLDTGEVVKEINVYHIPKKSIEYIETKFIIQPSGNIESYE